MSSKILKKIANKTNKEVIIHVHLTWPFFFTALALLGIKNVKLFFKTGLQDLNKIAEDERADSELALLKILMQEKYNITPEYIEMKPNLEHMLKWADAALLIGNEALHEQELNKRVAETSRR